MEIEEGARLGVGCVLRAGGGRIEIGPGASLADLVVVHSAPGFTVRVGSRSVVGPNAVLMPGGLVPDDGAVPPNGVVAPHPDPAPSLQVTGGWSVP